ncbi:MAG: DNA-protecting protein DprA [Oscillospiraceae bacterium]|nr:DNA-protecting protein DprA [Oscillospiraceae bacterium]
MSALKYWLWLSGCDVSARAKAALFLHYGDAQQAFMAPKGDYRMIEGISRAECEILEKRDLSIADIIYGECQRQFIEIISYQDARYPKRLRNIYAPPAVLYLKGKLPNIDENAAIAVVGTRKASVYGIKMARNMANDISRCGAIVISGLTRGIDAAAAEGALLADGVVVAVLGTSHEKDKNPLSPDVAVKGAVISEYPPTREMRNSFFRERNRISAGLSVGVLAVEAPESSGTALFVEEAVEQGKEIFAVPGNADSVSSAGTLNMLKDGAKLVTCGYDVVSEFEYLFPGKLHPPKGGSMVESSAFAQGKNPQQNAEKAGEATKKVIDKENDRGYIDLKEQLSKLSETQLKIITAIDANASHIDDIIEATGLPTATVLAQLTVLEIKGYVRRQAGKRITLNTAKK